jgi:hypothetical protein
MPHPTERFTFISLVSSEVMSVVIAKATSGQNRSLIVRLHTTAQCWEVGFCFVQRIMAHINTGYGTHRKSDD